MRILEAQQGSPEWLRLRASHFCASDAPVMMGASKKSSRQDMVRAHAIGTEKEISEWVQCNLFDKGHEAEAAIRPHVESLIGEDLYPVVGAVDVEGLDLPLLASFDGITLDHSRAMEHKLLNGENVEIVEAGDVPEDHIWQLEHQAIVSDAKEIIFVVSDGTPDSMRHCIYRPDPERRKRLLAGWKQFIEDVRNYQHVEVTAAPEGRSPESLPALNIEVRGMVAASNLDEFRSTAMAVIGSVNTALETDQDFADAEKSVKWCKDVEDRLDAAKQHALSQTADIDRLFRTIDKIKDEARAKRLELDKLVKARKESIRADIVAQGQKEVANYCAALDNSVGYSVPRPAADFAGAIKGKKLLSAMRDAVSDVIASAKIAANDAAEVVRTNLRALDAEPEFRFLFNDLAAIISKSPDDFAALVRLRVADHKASIEAKERAEREARETRESAERDRQEREKREAVERAERAEADRKAAEERAAKAAQEAEDRVRREAEEKSKREADEAAKRERNTKHRGKIHREIVASLSAEGVSDDMAKAIVTKIAKGAVPHVSIQY